MFPSDSLLLFLAVGSAACPSVWQECQERIELLATNQVPISDLLSKIGDKLPSTRPRERVPAPIFPPLLPGKISWFLTLFFFVDC